MRRPLERRRSSRTRARAIALAPGEQSYRRQLAAIEAASADRRAPAVHPPHPEAEPAAERRRAPPSLEVDLRPVQTGEERVLGDLLSIDCGDEGIRFSVRVGSQVVVATAERMLDVELTSFVGTRNLTIGCGSRTPPDRVYLTSKSGQAVAVEFLPHDYVP